MTAELFRLILNPFHTATPRPATKARDQPCDHAILAVAQMSNRALYVGSSRGRQSVKVYTPDFEHLYDSVKRNSEHLTGHDLIAARQEYINDISPKQDIENIPKNEEIQQISQSF
jgi:hypothetical protein